MEIHLGNISSFGSVERDVVKVDLASEQAIAALRQRLVQQLPEKPEDRHPFHPHITIAFRKASSPQLPPDIVGRVKGLFFPVCVQTNDVVECGRMMLE